MNKILHHYLNDDSAAGAIEYALVILLTLSTLIALTPILKGQITSFLTTFNTKLATGSGSIS